MVLQNHLQDLRLDQQDRLPEHPPLYAVQLQECGAGEVAISAQPGVLRGSSVPGWDGPGISWHPVFKVQLRRPAEAGTSRDFWLNKPFS